MTVMALSCLNQKTSLLDSMHNASAIYNETIRKIILNQKRDGSFGNAHTTAMVTQVKFFSKVIALNGTFLYIVYPISVSNQNKSLLMKMINSEVPGSNSSTAGIRR